MSQIDLMPTVLEILGIPIPEQIEGSSLVPLIDGRSDGEEFDTRPVFSEATGRWAFGEGRKLLAVKPPSYAVRLGSRKLARYRTETDYRYEYYDLATDPLEQRNLYPDRADEAADLLALLGDYQRRSAELRARLDGDAGATSFQPSEVSLDPEQEQRLKALGYVQ